MTNKTHNRITKDQYFMEIAQVISQRSTCIKRKVGAVLVKENHIISTGYNGAPSGFTHCTPESCLRQTIRSGERPELCRGVHAEINCVIQAALHGTSIKGKTTLYTTTFPCMNCLKLLINSGINRIVYKEDYNLANTAKKALLNESNIVIEKF